MQLSWLEDLVALAEAGSLVRAARRRHVTHPAFGRRIKALEHWSGGALIDRQAETLRFTPQGLAMLDTARETIAALAAARAGQADAGAGDTLRVVTGRTLARTLLATWCQRMQPQIGTHRIKVTTGALQAAAAVFENRDADFLLTYFHSLLALRLDARRFTYVNLADEALVPVSGVQPDGRAMHTLSRRHAAPWLAYDSGLALARLVDDHLRSHLKPPRLRAAFELDSADAAHEFVLRGFGIAWLPRSMVAADCRLGRMVQLGERSEEIRLEVRLYRPRQRLSPLAEAVWGATAMTLA